MCKPPKDQQNENENENEKIHEKLWKEYYKTESKEYYKPENLWVGQKAIRKLFSKHWDFKEKNQILVSSTSVMASSYSTSKRYRTSTLSSYNPQSTPSI